MTNKYTAVAKLAININEPLDTKETGDGMFGQLLSHLLLNEFVAK